MPHLINSKNAKRENLFLDPENPRFLHHKLGGQD